MLLNHRWQYHWISCKNFPTIQISPTVGFWIFFNGSQNMILCICWFWKKKENVYTMDTIGFWFFFSFLGKCYVIFRGDLIFWNNIEFFFSFKYHSSVSTFLLKNVKEWNSSSINNNHQQKSCVCIYHAILLLTWLCWCCCRKHRWWQVCKKY